MFRLSRNLDHDGAERRTGERVARRAQGARDIGHAQQQDTRGIKAEFEEARRGQLAEFDGGKILADPEKGFALPRARGQCRGETAGGDFASRFGGKDFMQGAALQPALQAGVGGFVTERDAGVGGDAVRYIKSGKNSLGVS